jgi:lipopolysaccharide/colanic/teichoic acid biosynthesis glycosyltransferase
MSQADGHRSLLYGPHASNGDSISVFLRKVIEEHLDAEHVPKESIGCDQHGRVAIGTPVQQACSAPLPLQALPTWKRILDITLIVLTYPIWLPVMLIVMAGIKISSAGPVFYRQERVGFGGRRFMIFKFRSMKVHAETHGHESYCQQLMRNGAPMTKLDAADDRIIPWGRVLRATGLDELPQIFNVLRGEMSLVGPRPCTPLEFERYQGHERDRVQAAPGLTGYWQVNGKNRTTFKQMIEMDLFYARNASLKLDLWIIAKTPAALLEQTVELLQNRANAFAKLDRAAQTVVPPSDGGVL